MTVENIFVFALVGLVATSAAVVWLIFDLRQQARTQALWRSTYESFTKQLRIRLADVEKQSPVALAAQVAELSDAVSRLSKVQQRFQGRFDQYVHAEAMPDNAPPTIDRDALRRAHADDILPVGVRR